MKKILLTRHAKSSWKDMSLSDRERPLNKRGKRDAPEMGQRLVQRGIQLDLIISSPAKRAIKTATKLAKEVGYTKKIMREENLYDASEWHILEVIRSLDSKFDKVMLVAHNPGLTDLVNQISGRRLDNVPTCGIVELDYNIETWEEVGESKPEAFLFDYPKKARGI